MLERRLMTVAGDKPGVEGLSADGTLGSLCEETDSLSLFDFSTGTAAGNFGLTGISAGQNGLDIEGD